MVEPLDDQYLRWLYARIGSIRIRNRHQTYWHLLRQLYSREFVWLIANDDNRVEDGRDLRLLFLGERPRRNETDLWMGLGCSVLELLISVSSRLAFQDGGSEREWFWQLLENLGLDDQNDANHDEEHVEDILNRLIWRLYEPNGSGGLFPLERPAQDQRRVEIWYQLCAYILERG